MKTVAPAVRSKTPLVRLNGLSLRINDRWLFRNLDLEVPPGTFVAVVGPSGAGKTSFLNCLAGILSPTAGEISYVRSGRGEIGASAFRKEIGIIFQQLCLAENNTVLTNVLCGRLNRYSSWRTLFGFPATEKDEAFAIIHNLGISEYVHRWVAKMSGGEKQRVSIARALFQNPRIYLADEPVSQLDAYLTGRVLGLLKMEAKNRNRIVFCVLHDPRLVQRFADVVLAFNRDRPEDWNLRYLPGKRT